MKPYAFTDNRSLMLNRTEQEQEQVQDEDKDAVAQDDDSEANYPRDLNMRGLLVSVAISAAVVALLVITII